VGAKSEMTPICPYCGKESKRVKGDVIYPHRYDLHSKVFYQCSECDAYVGCHPRSDKPLGGLANGDLRRIRSLAHRAFDPLWNEARNESRRRAAYSWLADQLGIPSNQCHIGQFDVETCKKVLDVCRFAKWEEGRFVRRIED
jgi:hypothetical protein